MGEERNYIYLSQRSEFFVFCFFVFVLVLGLHDWNLLILQLSNIKKCVIFL